MRGLIALVTVMSLLIVAGIGLLVWGVIRTGAELQATRDLAPLELPAGMALKQVSGYDGGAVLHVAGAEGEFVYFYDLSAGKLAARLPVRKAP